MKSKNILFAFLIIVFSASILNAQKNQSFLSKYDFTKSNQILKLDKELDNISDLVVDMNGKFYAKNFETGKLFELDIKTGKIINSFNLSNEPAKEKFKGITIADNYFYSVNNTGEIFQLKKTIDKGFVVHQKYATKLNQKNEVEGITYNPKENKLLVVCKGEPGFALKEVKAIYLFDLKSNKLENFPSIMIHLSEIKKQFGLTDFSPSDIEYNTANGNLLILSSKDPAIIELSPRRELIDCIKLDKNIHWNPESITVTKDDKIIISDKVDKKFSKLSFYNKKIN